MNTSATTTKRPQKSTTPIAQSTSNYADASSFPTHFSDSNQFDPDALSSAGFDPALFPPRFQSVPQQNYSNVGGLNAAQSNQLVRRSLNNQLATSQNPNQQQWMSPDQQLGQSRDDLEPMDDLDARAAIAKQEAQAKRKQIPPFVLKLWSFLNEDKNTDLIRWTDDGTAFTVLDEDEFARTLIPELFKHNNYASFVRQLNMYGFHKKVGLNANSMKAAEKKTKDPNVYWHEYFRQGREDLLWLIQKPQSKSSSAKRKRGSDNKDGGSDDERHGSPDIGHAPLSKIARGDADMVAMPKSEVVELRQEVQKLQRQQGIISKMIGQLKDQNEQIYRQAGEFRSQHERHENSINAILTFLATFYNRSLEAGVDLTNMFANQNSNQTQQQGTVVDMGDNDFQDPSSQQMQRYRKPQLLLQSSPMGAQTSPTSRRVSTQPPSTRNSESPPLNQQPRRSSRQTSGTGRVQAVSQSPIIKDEAETPGMDSGEMMSLINAANASTPSSATPQFDFNSALNHAQNANGQGPLTQQQRDSMLNMIANQQANASQPGANNALMTPNPPPGPDLAQYHRTQEQLNQLTRLQREQDAKMQDLALRLQPLSPNGSIPGLDVYGNQTPPADFDFDSFLKENPSEYDNDQNNMLSGVNDAADGANFNWDDFGAATSNDGAELFTDVADLKSGEIPKVQSVHSDSEGQTGTAT